MKSRSAISLLREKEFNNYYSFNSAAVVLGYSEDMVKGLCRNAAVTNHEGCVNSVKFTKDGKLMVSGSDDGVVNLWDAKTIPESTVLGNKEPMLLGSVHTHHTQNIFCADVCPCNENWVISCAADGTVRLNDLSYVCTGDVYSSLVNRRRCGTVINSGHGNPTWDKLDSKERVLHKSMRMM